MYGTSPPVPAWSVGVVRAHRGRGPMDCMAGTRSRAGFGSDRSTSLVARCPARIVAVRGRPRPCCRSKGWTAAREDAPRRGMVGDREPLRLCPRRRRTSCLPTKALEERRGGTAIGTTANRDRVAAVQLDCTASGRSGEAHDLDEDIDDGKSIRAIGQGCGSPSGGSASPRRRPVGPRRRQQIGETVLQPLVENESGSDRRHGASRVSHVRSRDSVTSRLRQSSSSASAIGYARHF